MTKTICKSAKMINCYPLSGGWVSSRNFWNNKAAVIECKGGYKALQSYHTIVAVIYRGKLYRTWGGYSVTTQNHINRFAQMYLSKSCNKRQWENMEVFNTSIRSLDIDYSKKCVAGLHEWYQGFRILYPKTV